MNGKQKFLIELRLKFKPEKEYKRSVSRCCCAHVELEIRPVKYIDCRNCKPSNELNLKPKSLKRCIRKRAPASNGESNVTAEKIIIKKDLAKPTKICLKRDICN